MRRVATGMRNADVAERLFISPGTVKVHLMHIFSKLGIFNRAQPAGPAATRDSNIASRC